MIEDQFLKIHKTIEKIETNDIHFFEFEQNKIIRLFFLSQIWRISKSEKFNFKLTEKFEKKIGRILDRALRIDLKNPLFDDQTISTELVEIPMYIVKTVKDKLSTNKPVLLNSNIKKPYFLIINDYIIILYEKESHTKGSGFDCYGISKYISLDYLNYNESKFQIVYFNRSKWDDVLQRIIKAMNQDNLKIYLKLLYSWHKKSNNSPPTQNQIKAFIQSLYQNNIPPGIKYSEENILKALKDSLNTI